jgi:predicted phage terminase large subunit-like protein
MMDELIRAEIDRQKAARDSLVGFRNLYFASSNDQDPAPYHHQWSDILLYGTRHAAIEAFRESAKTQIVIRANLLHALAFPHPKRGYIVIICATGRTAAKKLLEVSREMHATPKIGLTVSHVVEDSGNALEVHYQDGAAVRMEAYGKGAAVRGLSWGAKRPDLIIIDDPQDPEDARSETVTETDWDWFLSDVYFLGQESRIFLIGNNLGERCIIERVIGNADDLGFDIERIPIMDEEERPAWPARHTTVEILKEREDFAKLGKINIWYREKMCKSIAPDSQMFKADDFRYYEPEKLKTGGMSIYMTVDPAASTAESADRTAICVVGVNAGGHWFVLDSWAERKRPIDCIDAIFRLCAKWRPLIVGIEAVAYQAALLDFLSKEMPARNLFFRIEPLKAAKKKELRIETALQPRFAVHSLWFPALTPWVSGIEEELLAFPHGLHDDRIDALSYVDQIAVVPMYDDIDDGEEIDCNI